MPKSGINYLKVFETFGVFFGATSGNEAIADECFACGKAKHLYVNRVTGVFKCHSCGTDGNSIEFVRYMYEQALASTDDGDYRRLKARRDIPLQTLKRHGLAFDSDRGEWLIPFKSPEGKVLTLQRYNPESGQKRNLPGFKMRLYGLDQLSADPTLPVFLCEGPFDAIALDAHLIGAKSRHRYDILAVPGANGFSDGWCKYLKDRPVKIVFDNDDTGRQAGQRVGKKLLDGRFAREVTTLKWPDTFPEKFDIDELVREHSKISVPKFVVDNSFRQVSQSRLQLQLASEIEETTEAMEWLWSQHIPCGSFVTFFGSRGTYKSTIARDLAARVTVGRAMPDGSPGVAPSDVIYFTSEDSVQRVREDVKRFGGNLARLKIGTLSTGDDVQLNQLNLLTEFSALKQEVAAGDVKLVIVDALNSFVGAPDISTDQKGRSNVSNYLHKFAQDTGVCLLGLRNMADGSDGRALGSQSMSDISRSIFRTANIAERGEPKQWELIFDKVNDAPESAFPPLPFDVKDCGGHHREIVWGKGKAVPIDWRAFWVVKPGTVPSPMVRHLLGLKKGSAKG